jgi:hypothetical protein
MAFDQKTKWLLFSITGLLLTGLGMSVAIDAGVNKYSHHPWVAEGTLALVIFNAGLSLFGRGVAEYSWMKKK